EGKAVALQRHPAIFHSRNPDTLQSNGGTLDILRKRTQKSAYTQQCSQYNRFSVHLFLFLQRYEKFS
ncbi:MAG: hypothetical protein IK032_00085, partial [Bacteroidales bacterium]|nr:hypothetical protein [Bacteroidales bacterium]